MPRSIEILAYESALSFLRRDWNKRSLLNISLKNLKTGRFLYRRFEPEVMILQIKDLDRTACYFVNLMTSSVLQRFFHRSRNAAIMPQSSPPSILFIGSGRSGTTSISDYLDGLEFNSGAKVCSRHETLFEYVLPALTAGNENDVIQLFSGFRHDIEAFPHLSCIADKLPAKKVVHIIRDGRRVVQSGINRGWYKKDDIWERVKPAFQGSLFEKCCRYWMHQVEYAELYATKTVRLEDLAGSGEELAGLLVYFDIAPTRRTLPRSNSGKIASGFQWWDRKQRDIFCEICGKMMDVYYPSWQAEW